MQQILNTAATMALLLIQMHDKNGSVSVRNLNTTGDPCDTSATDIEES